MKTAVARKSRLFRQTDRLLGKTAAAFAAATGVGLVGTAQEAQAQIVYSGTVNINIPTTTAGVYLNVVTGVNAITPGGAPNWNVNPWGSTSFNVWANNAAVPHAVDGAVAGGGSSATLVDNLPLNFVVDGTSTYVRTGGAETTGATAFLPNSTGYAGIRFFNDSTGLPNFGWVQFSLSASVFSQPRTIIDYAYDASGAGIQVGATGVPEPTSLALLSMGAAGLAAYRRRRGAAV